MGLLRKLLFGITTVVLLSIYIHRPLPSGLIKNGRTAIQLVMDLKFLIEIPESILSRMKYQNAWARTRRFVFNHKGLVTGRPNRTGIMIKNSEMAGVPVRVYIPDNREGKGALIHFHGGDWIAGNLYTSEAVLSQFVQAIRKPIVSVDYRLAPEYPFPAGLNDCEKATRYFIDEGYKQFNVDNNEIAISGEGAGGNLAAVVAHRLIDRPATTDIKVQVLLNPVVQMTDFKLPSYRQSYLYNRTSLLSPRTVAQAHLTYMGLSFKYSDVLLSNAHTTKPLRRTKQARRMNKKKLPQSYLNQPVNIEGLNLLYLRQNFKPETAADAQTAMIKYIFNPDMNPIYRENLTGLPATLVAISGFDVLRDEGYLYGDRLLEAGVPVVIMYYEDALHGAFSLSTLVRTCPIFGDTVSFIRRMVK